MILCILNILHDRDDLDEEGSFFLFLFLSFSPFENVVMRSGGYLVAAGGAVRFPLLRVECGMYVG